MLSVEFDWTVTCSVDDWLQPERAISKAADKATVKPL
jgi:hypothetical protein